MAAAAEPGTPTPDRATIAASPLREILFVDDEPAILDGLRNSLRVERRRWSMRFALGGARALEALAERAADVVVTDMRMPGLDGLELLGRVKAGWPRATRIVLSGYADLAAVAQASAVAHQYLLKPCDTETLRSVIERAVELQAVLQSEGLRRTVGSLGSLPAAPRAYQRLTQALRDPEVQIGRLADIVKQDLALASRVLQFVNSAYYGLARRVSSIEGAIVYLGINTLRHLTLTIEVQQSFPLGEGGAQLAAFERHSALTARIARRIAGDPVRGEVAFAAGLLHDAGQLVFMHRVGRAYQEAGRRARAERRPPTELERELIGADHAQVGAYLLGLWGLPHPILEAVAFHHDQARLARGTLDTVEAVGAANMLAHAADRDGGEEEPGLLERLSAERRASWSTLAAAEIEDLDRQEGDGS